MAKYANIMTSLANIADYLDKTGQYKSADVIDAALMVIAKEDKKITGPIPPLSLKSTPMDRPDPEPEDDSEPWWEERTGEGDTCWSCEKRRVKNPGEMCWACKKDRGSLEEVDPSLSEDAGDENARHEDMAF